MKRTGVLLLGSAFLLASCNRTEVTVPSDLNSISGTVVQGQYKTETNGSQTLVTAPWTGGTGSVIGTIATTTGQELTKTTLAADGKFSLNLKTPSDAVLVGIDPNFNDVAGQGAQCQGTINVGNTSARGAALMLTVDTAAQDGYVFPMMESAAVSGTHAVVTFTQGSLTYVNQGVTLKGVQTCTSQEVKTTVDVDTTLRQGWNKVTLVSKTDTAAKTVTVTIRSGSLPSDNWVYVNPSAPALGLQSLKSPKPPKFSLFR